MLLRRHAQDTIDPAADRFEEIVVPCASREAAEAEAERRQAEDSPDATWIYLRVDGEWAAKRTPTDIARLKPSLGSAFVDAVIENLHPENLLLGP